MAKKKKQRRSYPFTCKTCGKVLPGPTATSAHYRQHPDHAPKYYKPESVRRKEREGEARAQGNGKAKRAAPRPHESALVINFCPHCAFPLKTLDTLSRTIEALQKGE
jgi:hypothetical protein